MAIASLISEQFDGVIWRMEIDELSDTLFVEIRNEEERKVSFAAVSLSDGTVLFKNIAAPEKWLTGIEAAFDGVLLLHFYQSESGPAHKGLMAIEAGSAKILWSNYTYTFDYLTEKGPVVYDVRIHPRKLFLLDIKTGATERLYQPSLYKDLQNSIVLPHIVSPEELPVKLISVHPFGNSTHYLEYNNFRIVSLHALKGGELNQVLLVFDQTIPGSNTIVYEDLLNAGIQKMQPEAFIIHKNRLIYIKNKCELKVLPL
ncbi:DUF4905 domain-containing protein [Mucilaginibacter gotjawali]|uniref:Uncharacterized protein n=2 Tax=Mucilaginibacter gotjawali TaxID=1550579 RepID=A0A839SH46_9SPHI|nr:DUF4905 domain-containing protein [Mucilaginibacter gotjawali]MBB3055899.1 hypothetical protein [Mucilaginibacter gotjawali]BAU54721.1 hypothetical protein MgSA37_02899 [Mucilaginibacter gotjawali]